MRLSAVGSFFTSIALAAIAWGGEDAPRAALVTSLEMEAAIAKSPVVYMVIDPARRVLEVRSRSLVLDRVALDGIEVVTEQPLFSGWPPTLPELPATWKIAEGPGDTDREIVAPPHLRPYVSPEEEDTAEPTPTVAPAGPAPTPTPVPEPPASYRARLDNGWDLLITDTRPVDAFIPRLLAAVRDGWQRLRGLGDSAPPAVALAMAKQDCQRIHHLMRTGTQILVLPTP